MFVLGPWSPDAPTRGARQEGRGGATLGRWSLWGCLLEFAHADPPVSPPAPCRVVTLGSRLQRLLLAWPLTVSPCPQPGGKGGGGVWAAIGLESGIRSTPSGGPEGPIALLRVIHRRPWGPHSVGASLRPGCRPGPGTARDRWACFPTTAGRTAGEWVVTRVWAPGDGARRRAQLRENGGARAARRQPRVWICAWETTDRGRTRWRL